MQTRSLVFSLPVLALVAAACADHDGFRPRPPAPVFDPVFFETRTEQDVGVGRSSDVEIADLTGDGVVDMAVTDLDGKIQIMVGQGRGQFAAGQTIPVALHPLAVRAADLDGDGDLDLCAVSAKDGGGSDEATVLLNDGAGNFAQSAVLALKPLATGLVLGHYDNDGKVDLLVNHLSAGAVQLFSGNGDGTFVEPSRLIVLAQGRRTSGLTLSDVNRDTLPDLLVCDTNQNEILVQFGEAGGGISQESKPLPVGAGPVAISVGDLTGDGKLDIAVSNFSGRTVQVLTWNEMTQAIETVMTLPVSGEPANSVIGDVTGDGVPDLSVCVLDRSSVSIFPGVPGGTVSDHEMQLSVTGFPYRPRVLDLDDDSVNDLVLVSSQINRINVFHGRPGGHGLRGGRTHEVGIPAPQVVAAADFDGDGAPDLVVGGTDMAAGGNQAEVVFLRSAGDPATGDPVLTEIAKFKSGRDVRNVSVADVNQDGKPDVLLAVAGGVTILKNTTTGGVLDFELVPGGTDVLAAGREPVEMVAVDVTGDGLLDLVISYHLEEQVVVLPAAGPDLTFGAPVVTPLTGRPIGLAVGDFDGDGALEVAVSRSRLATITILEFGPGGGLTPSADIPVGAMPDSLTNFVRTADFNKDGRADLVVSNYYDEAVTLLMSQGGGSFSVRDIPAGELPTALLIEDLNRDGNLDILVAALRGTDFRVLLGDGSGGTIDSSKFPGTYGAGSAALANLNGDPLERPDLVIGSILTERISVFKNVSPLHVPQ